MLIDENQSPRYIADRFGHTRAPEPSWTSSDTPVKELTRAPLRVSVGSEPEL
jgi:hypothetical protein